MDNRHAIARAVRRALLLGALCTAGTSAAQQPAGGAEGAENLEEVVVTGSRIASPNLESVSPLQVIDAQDLDRAGAVNVQEVLLDNPAVGTPTISRTNSAFSTSSAGVATVDLRNLGVSRTLVLVNGRRFVAGIPGESAVDLNTIPQQFIERIDVLTGGASAVYGSDAVAGVVNIVYRDDFEGIALDTQYGASSEYDDRETQAALTVGTNVADGRGNVAVHLGYTEQGAVFSRNRARSAVDQFSTGVATGDPTRLFEVTQPFYSSFAPQGRFVAGNSVYTYDPTGALVTGFSTNGTATRAANGFNRSEFRSIAVPTERWLLATRGNYEVAENQRVFFEGTYASSEVSTQIEPFALGAEDIYPAAGGQVPVEFDRFVAGAGGAITRQRLVNPLIPAPMLAAATDTDGDGVRDIYFTRRLSDIGNRTTAADRDTFRLVGGFEGEIAGGWRYDAYYGYGQTKEAQTSTGQVNVLNFRNALEAVPDVDDVDGDGNRSEAICRSAEARAQGCAPANVWAGAGALAGSSGYIGAPGSLTTTTRQTIAGVNVSGEVLQLPAGPLGVAVGGEYRDEFARSEFDVLTQQGLNAGNAIPNTRGSFDVIEGYVETNVPVLGQLPLVDLLSLRAAARFSDYSTVGNTTSWNAGLEWQPIPQLRFRAIRAQSVRAPNINELYSPPSQTFPTGLNDPCAGVTATSTTAASARCRAAPGVLANIAANGGAFRLNQSDLQGVSGFDRGNPDLEEEKGRSWTFGLVVQPEGVPFLENFGFTIDYFDIEIADAILLTPRQFVLDQCYTGDAAFCSLITRRPNALGANNAGSLEFIDSPQSNSGGFNTRGVDVTVNWSQSLEEWGVPGSIDARLAYTHLLEGYEVPAPGAERDYFENEIGASDDRAFLQLGYSLGGIAATWRTTYIGEARLDDQFLAGFDLPRGAVGVGGLAYHDVQVSYTALDRYEIFVGANNVFDKEPPPIISGLPGNDTGTETNAGTYDPIGRRYYGGVRVKF